MARIVFDLDGTLIDSAADLQGIANGLLSREGAAPLSLAEARDFIGNGVAVFVARMRAARGIPDSEQARLLDGFLARYDDAVEQTVAYPGVPETLAALRAHGHRLGVCTNKPLRPCRSVLAHLGLLRHFEVTIGGDSLPVHKPDPAPLVAAFRELGPGPAIYVGDSEIDAETARRAGAPFLLFTQGYRKAPLDEIPHDRAFDRFSDVPELVGEIVASGAVARAR
jgi:phosphoglycolate phosphatase